MNKPVQPYEIKLQNCPFFAHHGVLESEKKLGQRFYVDAKLQVDAKGALDEDRIDGTVHYGEAFSAIERIVTQKRFDLIESLALDVAIELCDQFPQILQAEITVRKPNAPIEGLLDYVEVTVRYPL